MHEALLNVLVAAGHVRDPLEEACRQHGVTGPQFNVLRILRGAQPDGLPRCEIVVRMMDRAPDVTRLIDRLETSGFVERSRSELDGRQSIARITRRGIALLERLDGPVRQVTKKFSERLNEREADQLSELLEKLYGEEL
jgi:DNA-binding MarR family transcriptional regulator